MTQLRLPVESWPFDPLLTGGAQCLLYGPERCPVPSAPSAHYTLVEAKTLLRQADLVDPWFLGRFGANLFRGCEHGCIYCDGRAERYYVDGDFERDIVVKRNALTLSAQEIAKLKEPGFLLLGGGVSDSYQPAESTFQLARGLLSQALAHRLSVHVLTKSALVERDFELLEQVARQRTAILSFSLQTTDDAVRARFEPRAASVSERLMLLSKARTLGIHGGIMAMPMLPGISDSRPQIEDLVQRAADSGAEFVCFGALTLRPGRQRDLYFDAVKRLRPELIQGYDRAYRRRGASGAPDPRYTDKLARRFADALAKTGLPTRIPRTIFHGMVPLYTEASVLLEHKQTEALLRGVNRPLVESGYRLARWAHRRLVVASRRIGFSYHDVEAEFVARLRDGSLRDAAGITEDAMHTLHQLGFALARRGSQLPGLEG